MHQEEMVKKWTDTKIRQCKVPNDRYHFPYSYELVIYSEVLKLRKAVTWTMKHLIITSIL